MAKRSHVMDLFYFVRGSEDFPVGHPVDEKFGYITSTGGSAEYATFDSSLRDLYNKMSNPKEVTNLYSLEIGPYANHPGTSHDVSQEFLSSIIINNGDEAEFSNVNPNYPGNDMEPLEGVDNDVGKTYRENEFWQKMFSLFEFLKYHESDIANNIDPSAVLQDYMSADPKFTGVSGPITAETNILGKYITAFLGNYEGSSDKYDTIRLAYLKEGYKAGSGITKANTRSQYWTTLNVKYAPRSASMTLSAYRNRIDKMTFTIYYLDDEAKNSGDNIGFAWTFNLYFVPDALISALGTSRFKVYTYNDIDFSLQRDIYPNINGADGFNYLDNDYAATLLKNIYSSNEENKHTVSTAEFETQVIKKLMEILKGGEFDNFAIFSTKRVIPHLTENPGTGLKEVTWSPEDPTKTTIQTFYVFYSGQPPATYELSDAVRNYLRNAHDHKNGNCGPQVYDDDGNVVMIGHGPTTEDINNFLANMYPELFSALVLVIIPGIETRFQGASSVASEELSKDPNNFIHPVAINDIYQAIRRVEEFGSFEFNPDGMPVTDGIHYPIEIFYMGGEGTNNANGISYDFPLIAIRSNDNSKYPLTSNTGYEAYKQKSFNDLSAPEENWDKLQWILLALYRKNFETFASGDGANKVRYSSIGDVDIDYAYDAHYDDPDGLGDGLQENVFNHAKFQIGGIGFRVFALRGKNFGSSTIPGVAMGTRAKTV